jgi:hypothetical protein
VKAGCKGDANVLRPTLMCTVPLILERKDCLRHPFVISVFVILSTPLDNIFLISCRHMHTVIVFYLDFLLHTVVVKRFLFAH